MAITLTQNLKLRVDSNLTANAKYNLERIDALGAVYLLDNTETVNIRSKVDINLLPENASTGGSGVGGTINASTASQPLDQFNIYSNETNLGRNARIDDNASGGTKKLQLIYKSDINGVVDNGADRQLAIDLEGANRNLTLGANLTLLGFNLTLNTTADSNIILPETGTVATLAGAETLTNKTIDADNNIISDIRNINIATSAGIVYSKLDLTGSIVNADVNSAAAIAYSKLALFNSVINNDISAGAAIAYSKLNLLGSIVNADISPSANIDASKLNLTGTITDSDVAVGAAIQGTKIDPDFGTQDISTDGMLILRGPSFQTEFRAAQSGQTNDLTLTLPPDHGPGFLLNDGTGALTWMAASGVGTVTSVGLALPSIFTVSGSPVTTSGTLTGTLATQTANTIFAGPSTGSPATPTFRSIVAADLPATTVVGVTDTASIDHTLTGSSLSSVVLPAGVDHDSLLNFNANEHIDHTSVSINTSANSGLAGGGTIAATRSLTIDPTNAPLVTAAANDILIIADASNSNALAKVLVSDITALSSGAFAANWTSGTSFNVNHLLNSRDVIVELYSLDDYATIYVDSVIRTDLNNVDLTSSVAPPGSGFRVLIKRI